MSAWSGSCSAAASARSPVPSGSAAITSTRSTSCVPTGRRARSRPTATPTCSGPGAVARAGSAWSPGRTVALLDLPAIDGGGKAPPHGGDRGPAERLPALRGAGGPGRADHLGLRYWGCPISPRSWSPLRGQTAVNSRIAYAGAGERAATETQRLFAPLGRRRRRHLCSVVVGALPHSQIGTIHNDPTRSRPASLRAGRSSTDTRARCPGLVRASPARTSLHASRPRRSPLRCGTSGARWPGPYRHATR